MVWNSTLLSTLLIGFFLLSCHSPRNEKVPDSKPLSSEVYKKQLEELQEPEGMLEKEKFFAKKAFLEEQSGLIPDAIASLEMAIQLNPYVGLYHFRLAKLYRQKNMLTEARKSAEMSINLGTNTEDLLLFLAELFLQEGSYRKGLDYLDDRFSGLPESPELLSIRGRLLMKTGDPFRAISDLTKASENGNITARKVLAIHYLDKNPLESIKIIGDDSMGDDSLTWILIRAYHKLGRLDTLPNLMELLREPVPDQILSLARMFRDADQYSQAREQYSMLIEQDSTHTTAINELAELERNIAYLQNTKSAVQADTLTQLIQRDSVSNNE